MSKLKSPPPKVITLAEAQAAASDYQKARIRLAKVENTISERLAKIRQAHQNDINEANDVLFEADAVLKAYGEQERDKWEKKSLDLTFCTIGYRAGSRKVCIIDESDDKEALAAIKADKVLAKQFVAIVESIDKKAVLACKDTTLLNWLNEYAGVYVDRDADKFYVEPKTEGIS